MSPVNNVCHPLDSPGKIILSGEHAVVHGLPGITLAIDLFTRVKIKPQSGQGIYFEYLNQGFHYSWEQISEISKKIKNQYQKFLNQQLAINEVIKKPVDLLIFTAHQFFEKCQVKIKSAINVQISSNIPVGGGLGSSAAAITSLLKQLAHYCQLKLNLQQIKALAEDCENLQHGKSSGLDIATVLHGGCLFYDQGQVHARELPTLPLYVVNTGMPLSTTGECVTHTSPAFQHQKTKQAFLQTTLRFDDAIKTKNTALILEAIRTNHRLLVDLGVVPSRVQQFIAEAERSGAAAKISGAGSLRGETAGNVVLLSSQSPAALAENYGYSVQAVQSAHHQQAAVAET